MISIHAAREGGDAVLFIALCIAIISIHAAREGGDTVFGAVINIFAISIHAAREGGDVCFHFGESSLVRISIHAAREGGDSRGRAAVCGAFPFQSTPPVKAATEWTADDTGVTKISIHAAREGGDGSAACLMTLMTHFNPRRP